MRLRGERRDLEILACFGGWFEMISDMGWGTRGFESRPRLASSRIFFSSMRKRSVIHMTI